jgi:tetratricopeptide (TPR) repeat protein
VAREAVAISEVGWRPTLRFANQQQRRIQNRLLIRNVNRSALGWSLYRQERCGDALVELERAAKISEQDSIPARAVYYRLGQTLEKLGRPRDAIEAY